MSSTRQMYADNLENYRDLLESERNLASIGALFASNGNVAGNEGLPEAFADLGSGMLSVAKWVGGKTLAGFSSVLGSAGTALSKSFSDNKVLIERITQKLKSDEEREYTLSEATVILLTCKGDADNLSHDMDVLQRHLDALVKHSGDVLNYLDKQLVAAKKLRNASTTDQVFAAVEAYDAVAYPVFHLEHSKGETQISDILPGGKTWEFDHSGDTVKYAIGGDVPTGASSSLTLDKSSVSNLLAKLAKINAMHTRLKDAYDGYLSFLRSWSDMVKSVEPNLSKLDKVSRTAIGQAEKIIAGDTQALAFYSGFTPRVVSYTDRYIHGVLGVFA